jgi:hypothetical protein
MSAQGGWEEQSQAGMGLIELFSAVFPALTPEDSCSHAVHICFMQSP